MTTTLTESKVKATPTHTTRPARSVRPLGLFSRGLSPFFGRAPFWALREEMDDLITQMSDEWNGGPLTQEFQASLDLSEDDNNVQVRLDVPGIDPENIEVEVAGDLLKITGERKEEQEEKTKTYHRVERRYGSFARAITLPCEIIEDQIDATCDNGVLTITLPKNGTTKARRISVKPVAK
ncbi:Spore protein SP21 [Gimesia panareensis]|uniref:Spore protein SP21 n=1 Tax=Gimesia panareensis TaxID=2527978 RepID=A0A518FW23_9PLAN|nr:Hsp20/alpha crystallin family protein [Gimesia panareensis]QDV20553.1 Spore protein SP21 [Gimesia panareensis]